MQWYQTLVLGTMLFWLGALLTHGISRRVDTGVLIATGIFVLIYDVLYAWVLHAGGFW